MGPNYSPRRIVDHRLAKVCRNPWTCLDPSKSSCLTAEATDTCSLIRLPLIPRPTNKASKRDLFWTRASRREALATLATQASKKH